jgi:class 3 adenylate cyclase
MEASNRTFVCSVLFLDIAEYSKRSVAEQMTLKQRFNALLSQALRRIAVDERIVLDTGDGAAVSFLGNPEDTLFVAIGLRDAMSAEQATEPVPLAVRFGINLGPVRLIKDFNGQLNIIGDGINVAQRVMSFSGPGRILVSRSYYEVVSRLDPQFGQLFEYQGARTDKHVREHEVYAVGAAVPRWSAPAGTSASPGPRLKAASRLSRRLSVALPLTMAAIIGTGVAIRTQRDTSAAVVLAPSAALPAATPVDNAPSARTLAAPAPMPLRAEAAQPVSDFGSVSLPGGKETRKRPAPRKEAVRQAAPATPASAVLLVVPWGEVLVNGQPKGVTPPLRVLELTPGRHRIEIRNTSFPSHRETVTVRPGEKLTIRHRFH